MLDTRSILHTSSGDYVYADVILPLNLPQMLTYGIPENIRGMLKPGMRVEVGLGKNKFYAGIVAKIHPHKPEGFEVRPVKRIIDDKPVVSAIQLQFWDWIASYYMVAPGEVMQAALPAHLKLTGETTLRWVGTEADMAWSDDAYLAAEALSMHKELKFSELRTIVGPKKMHEVIYELLEKGVVSIEEMLEHTYVTKKEKIVYLSPAYQSEEALQQLFKQLEKAPKQSDLLMSWILLSAEKPTIFQKELLKKSQATSAQLKQMADKGIFFIEEMDVDRLAYEADTKPQPLRLTPAQQTAYESIQKAFHEKKVVLLEGVTGSGKTMIYVARIQEALRQGQQALMMLPEIALTTQLVSRLRNFFGEELGVYHSKFSQNERMEIWEKVRKGIYKVIVGPRSAIWLPYTNLGCIVIDEEHDGSYKQKDPAPRFHARDAAIYLATLYDANVILGSATPSVESLYNAHTGKYGYVTLKERYQGVKLPEITLVQPSKYPGARNQIITPPLQEAIARALAQKKQVVLFRNRRGYAPFLICMSCGWVAHCKKCSVSLTYHKATDKLHCHYCGLKSSIIHTCPSCGSNQIRNKTAGTEKVEEEVALLFPQARIARMDTDSTRGKNSLSTLLDNLAAGKIDILVGTQMVVKGLDFPMVALVGILQADSLLSFPDFRVNERAFQLMEQVSGRAGRLEGKGEVIIQTHNTTHPVLQWVIQHDVSLFYQHEIEFRKQFRYPPFARLIVISCRHTSEEKAKQAGQFFAEAFHRMDAIEVHGPVPAVISRIKNVYHQEVWIKCPPKGNYKEEVKKYIAQLRTQLMTQRGFGKIQIVVDVDPL